MAYGLATPGVRGWFVIVVDLRAVVIVKSLLGGGGGGDGGGINIKAIVVIA